MHHSIAPWARTLLRLDGIHSTEQRRPRRTPSPETPDNNKNNCSLRPPSPPSLTRTRTTRPPPRRSPATSTATARLAQSTQPTPRSTTDPLSLLPLHVVSDIVSLLSPADLISSQRVSKSWRATLASEYIYTLALRFHFSFTRDADRVWTLHRSGRERFPAASVAAYRKCAKAWCRRKKVKPVSMEIVERKATDLRSWEWTCDGKWMVWMEEWGIVAQRIGVGAEKGRRVTIHHSTMGVRRVEGLRMENGMLRVKVLSRRFLWQLLFYSIDPLKKLATHELPNRGVTLAQNMTETHTGYIDDRTLHLLTLPKLPPPTPTDTDIDTDPVPTLKSKIYPAPLKRSIDPVLYLTPTHILQITGDTPPLAKDRVELVSELRVFSFPPPRPPRPAPPTTTKLRLKLHRHPPGLRLHYSPVTHTVRMFETECPPLPASNLIDQHRDTPYSSSHTLDLSTSPPRILDPQHHSSALLLLPNLSDGAWTQTRDSVLSYTDVLPAIDPLIKTHDTCISALATAPDPGGRFLILGSIRHTPRPTNDVRKWVVLDFCGDDKELVQIPVGESFIGENEQQNKKEKVVEVVEWVGCEKDFNTHV